MAAWAAVLFAFSACQDVVEVEDLKAKDDIPSNGAPEIIKIVLANDKEFEIDGADFEDMVRVEGKNLGNVVSVKFNDVEVDPKDLCSLRHVVGSCAPPIAGRGDRYALYHDQERFGIKTFHGIDS